MSLTFYNMLKKLRGVNRDTNKHISWIFLTKLLSALVLGVYAATRAEDSGG
jgi:hypothetical protein